MIVAHRRGQVARWVGGILLAVFACVPPSSARGQSLTPPSPRIIEASFDMRLLQRSLTYEDDLYGFLREYDLDAAPAVGMAVRWYPAAMLAAPGLWAHVGLDVRFEHSIALESHRSEQVSFPTADRALDVGVRGRLPFGAGHEAGLLLGYGWHEFEFRAAGPAGPVTPNLPDVPSVSYQFVRFGADLRVVPFGDAFVELAMAYLAVVDAGGIESDVWFPDAKARGVEGRIALGHMLPRQFEVHLAASLRRYWYDFDADIDDPFIAGGALDQYVTWSLGVGYRH